MGTILLILLIFLLIIFGLIALIFWGSFTILTSILSSTKFWIGLGVFVVLFIFFGILPGFKIVVGLLR